MAKPNLVRIVLETHYGKRSVPVLAEDISGVIHISARELARAEKVVKMVEGDYFPNVSIDYDGKGQVVFYTKK